MAGALREFPDLSNEVPFLKRGDIVSQEFFPIQMGKCSKIEELPANN